MSHTQEVLIVAGEASGDHYAAELVTEARTLDPDLRFFGLGGGRMSGAGVELLEHLRSVQVMGFVEVVSRLGSLYRVYRRLAAEARRRRPAAVVLVDFPDFNLRLAAKLKRELDAPILYYVGPTVWAWRSGRVETIGRIVDKMLVILPFEEELYRKAGVDVEYVGHPLVGRVAPRLDRPGFFRRHGWDEGRRLVALLPGSREREIAQILPPMLAAARALASREDLCFALGLADTVERRQVDALLVAGPALTVIEGETWDLMAHADAALVASGTATLETALSGTPMVVVYRTQALTWGLASRLVRVPWACIVNIILGRQAVPELLQHEFRPERAAAELERLLTEAPESTSWREDYRELGTRLGPPGAAGRAARVLVETIGATVGATT